MDLSSPLSALAGGALIGLAASALWLLNGRIAGISGIVGGALRGAADRASRVAFALGLLAGGAVMALVLPAHVGAPLGSASVLSAAGLLVGVGSTLANGCTSGHGVCGVGRLSPRSLVATAAFLSTGAVVVALRGWLG